MAFEYGSTGLGIQNPFKKVGLIQAIRGAIVSAMGIYCLLMVKGLVETNHKIQGWLTMAAGVVLLAEGLTALGMGIFKIMRFFVGRSVPTSLSKNFAKSEAHMVESDVAYTSQQIEQMLQGRKNLTFTEPADWFARLIHTLLPKLILMPYIYRNMAQRVVKALAHTLIAFLCFALAWFSGTTGLSTINQTTILDWLALALTVYLIHTWLGIRQPLERALQRRSEATRVKDLVLYITVAIFLPFALLYVNNHLVKLPKLHMTPSHFIWVICFLGLVVSAVFFFLLLQRMHRIDALTEVSEYRDNWQESIHPQEMFIHFESIVMANRRFKEVPNRVYREFDARLFEEGSNDKGHFKGEMIQETQPVFKELSHDKGFAIARTVLTVAGHSLLVLAACWLMRTVSSLAALDTLGKGDAMGPVITASAGILMMGAILWTFGGIMANFALALWAEMQFESLIVYFNCQGTYTASKLSTGASIYDSTRSENTVVRSSLTPWIIACRVVTCSFAGSGTKNLEYARHIVEMHKADQDLKAIVGEIVDFMKSRQAIAGIGNQKDLDAASHIYQVNAQTRVGYARAKEIGRIEDRETKDSD
ncbi:MAG: hypothetical protein M0036_01925 [Desulfobacteraceae bacterium]|nr:hypothetical protein [Desulfobacteraceae bacterium]